MDKIFSYDNFHVSEVFSYCGIDKKKNQGL